MSRFRIVCDVFPDVEAPQIRALGFLPFKLRAMLDVERPSRSYVFGIYVDVDLQYDALRSELGEPLDPATIGWVVAQAEERLRSGRIPTESTRDPEKLILTEPDLVLLRNMASRRLAIIKRD